MKQNNVKHFLQRAPHALTIRPYIKNTNSADDLKLDASADATPHSHSRTLTPQSSPTLSQAES